MSSSWTSPVPPSGSWVACDASWIVSGAAARRARPARVGVVTTRGYDATVNGGIAVRRGRLRHPADAVIVGRRPQDVDERPRTKRAIAQRDPPERGPTIWPDAGSPPARVSREVNHTMFATRTALRTSDAFVRAATVALVLGTAYIHSTLGGLLFTLNSIGYVVAAVAMVVPLALAVRFRWIVRIGLIGYAATAILGWAIMGPYYSTAYVAKAIEVALIVLVAIDFVRHDGSPISVVRRELAAFTALISRRGTVAAGA